MSPLLYVLCVEVLASLIRSSPGIEEFLLLEARGLQARVRLYADDTKAILRNLRFLTNLFDWVSVYENGFSAELNRGKTEAMWLRAWRSRSDEPLGLTWFKKIKILGVVLRSWRNPSISGNLGPCPCLVGLLLLICLA